MASRSETRPSGRARDVVLTDRPMRPRIRRRLGPLAVLAVTFLLAGTAAAVEPRFDASAPGPFPSDRLTVPDPTQRTGLRIAVPQPNCRAEPSTCDDVRLLEELDGFDLSPRLAVPFTGPIDPSSVSSRSVFLVRLAPGPPEALGIERLVYDPANHTLYARPEGLLEPETRYGLVVTRALRDAAGRAVRPAPGFRRLLAQAGGSPPARSYRQRLLTLMAALGRRGVRPDEVVAASVFTTGSVSTFLEQARDALDRRPLGPALITAPEGGGRAYFPRARLGGLLLRRQIGVATGETPAAFEERPLPLAALPPEVGGLAVGWFWSPWYLTPERRLLDRATARPLLDAPTVVPVPFVIVIPAGAPPPGGWPVALVGHGYGGEMFASALLIAGTLARHGLATAGISVVGHGGGPESRLVVRPAAGAALEVRAPGRGVDLDGDGTIGPTEGLGLLSTGPLASLGLRDGLRQQVVDLMAFVRALARGLDVDGDGTVDTRGEPIGYVGQSLGGIYGTLLLAVDPRIGVGVLNVAGGPLSEIARLSPVFRPLLRDVLGRRTPPLLNVPGGFRDELPLAGDGPVVAGVPGALAIQDYLARAEWLARRGDPLAYARYLRLAPLPGQEPKRVLVQVASGDRVVPNPTSAALIQAGQLADAAALLRFDRLAGALPPDLAEPHPFLFRIGAPGVLGTIARAAQEQVARFLQSDGASVWNPGGSVLTPSGEPLFEVPAGVLPRRLGYDPE